jgi:BON domain
VPRSRSSAHLDTDQGDLPQTCHYKNWRIQYDRLSTPATHLEELEFDPSFSGEHIGVAVDNGVVTLGGHVNSYTEKLAVIAATRRVKGVHVIAENIEVHCPYLKKTADDQIAKRDEIVVSLPYPCHRSGADFVDASNKKHIDIQPTHWRKWTECRAKRV